MNGDASAGTDLALLDLGRDTQTLLDCCADRRNDHQSDQSGRRHSCRTAARHYKLVATYVVSYFVSTYGAVSYRLHIAGRVCGEPAKKQLTIR
jgi:hypothetical protein